MKHLVISTHHTLSKAFVEAAEMIAGKEALSKVETLCMLEGMSPEDFVKETANIISKDPDGEYLILVDLYGASPCNTSCLGFRKTNYRIVTGLNLGMILEALFKLDSNSLDELADELVNFGREGINKVYIPDC